MSNMKLIMEGWRGLLKEAEMQPSAPVATAEVQFPDWLKAKLERVHTKPGQGSVFAKSVDEIEKIVKSAVENNKDIANIANTTGTLTLNIPGVGYDLVKKADEVNSLQVVSKAEVEKEEGNAKVKVPAVNVKNNIQDFKTDNLTIIVRPMKDAAGQVLPNKYIILSAYPGDPNVPQASKWNGQYVVVIPSAQMKENKMKITKDALKSIIKEELSKSLNEENILKALGLPHSYDANTFINTIRNLLNDKAKHDMLKPLGSQIEKMIFNLKQKLNTDPAARKNLDDLRRDVLLVTKGQRAASQMDYVQSRREKFKKQASGELSEAGEEKLTPMQMAIMALERQFGKGSVSIGNKPAREVAGMPPAPPAPPKPAKKKMPQQVSSPTLPRDYIDTSREGT